MKRRKKFIPALKFDWLTRLFDPLMKLTFIEQKLRNDFLEQVNIKDNETILDFGCGTGTLAIMAKRKSPNAKICGVDVDFNILKIASNKTKKEDCKISLQSYDGISLPYEDETFDKVISSLVFHHLHREQKYIILNEIYRILKPGGELHILDFGKAKNFLMRIMFLPVQFFDGFSSTTDNIKGLLPEFIYKTGFLEVVKNRGIMTPLGTIAFYKAIKPL